MCIGGSLARIVTINEPGIPPAAFRVGGVVFANGYPVQAVAGYFLCQYPFAPPLVCGRVEKRKRINGETLHPPAIHLHLADIKGLPGFQRATDQPFRLFPRGRVIGFSGDIDRQGIQPGFLPGYGLHQLRGRFRLRCQCGSLQAQQNGQHECLFHGAYASCMCVERNANKPPRRAGREWSRRR